MSTETINPTELKSETLWKIAQDECGAFECDRDGVEDYSGMHFRHLGDLLRFAQLVIDRNDAAYARKIAAKQAIALNAPPEASIRLIIEWIRDNYQDHTIDSLCEELEAQWFEGQFSAPTEAPVACSLCKDAAWCWHKTAPVAQSTPTPEVKPEPTRSQKLAAAGYIPRPTGKTAGGLMREEGAEVKPEAVKRMTLEDFEAQVAQFDASVHANWGFKAAQGKTT